MTQNMNEVLSQATKKIAAIIQKTISKSSKGMNRSHTGAMAIGELENLIRSSDLEWAISIFQRFKL